MLPKPCPIIPAPSAIDDERKSASRHFLHRLIFAVSLVNLLVIACVALVLEHRQGQERAQAELTTQTLARILEENLVGFIRGIDLTLLSVRDEIARQNAAGGIDRHSLERLMAQHDARLPETLGLRVVDAQGVIQYAVTEVATAQANIADRPQFIEMRKNPQAGLVVSKPIFGRAAQKWVITLSRRLNNPDGTFAGDVHIAVALDQFTKVFSAIDLGPQGAVSLWGKGPTLIARYSAMSGASQEPGGITPSTTLTAHLDSDQEVGQYQTRSGADGVVRTFTVRKLGSLPLFLAVGIAEDDYLADWRKETRALGGLSLLFFLATTLSAWLFYRSWHHRETYTQSLERAKEEIEAERQLNASLLTSAGEGICGTDAQGNLTFVNPAAKQMLGWMDADPVGQSLHHLVHHHRPDGSDYPIDDCPTHKTLKDGTPRHVGAEAYWRKDGSSFPVEFTSTAICHNAQVIGSVTVFRDISASQETERRLRFFKEVLNRAKDPVQCIDPQDGFRVILANPAAEAHFGVSMEQLLTMRIPEWAPQFSEADCRGMEARLAADDTIVFETEHHTAQGLIPVEINLTAADVDGHLYWIAIVRDISERKRIEATLRTSAELARALMNASSDAAFLMDLDGIVLSANETMAARLQTSVEALIGQSFFKWIPADLAIIRQSLCQDVIRSGQPSHGHDERDGLILDNRIYPVHDAKGEIYQLAVFSRDVTEQSRQEQEIRQLLSYQRAILGNAPIGIAIFDQDRKFIEANPAFLDIFGWTGEDLQGQSARLLYSDDESFQATGAHAYPIIRESQSFRGDALMRTRDRGEIWVRLTGRLVDAANPQLGVIWATEDITERKALELDLKRSNEELERFAYVASHDLRQPLRVINGYLDLIEKTLGTDLSEELRTFIDFALDGGKRMDRMIVDLLDYSRIGRNTEGKEPVDLNKVLACAIGNLELLIEDTQGYVVIPALLPTLPGYESELERLFQNLISNAIKFRSADRSPKVTITCRKTSREWIIAISDNGIGIAPNDHNRLFQIFQRLVAREQYEGNGIGLAACRKIMEHHAGRIWLESELGTGSTFQVALPVR